VALALATIQAGELGHKGSAFDPGVSRNTAIQGEAALLAGMFSYGAAVYEFQVSPGLARAGAEVNFDNLKGKWLKLYIYNYGTARDDEAVRNRRLEPNWRLWESTDQGGTWRTGNPELLDLRSGDGRIDYLGPQNKIRLLLYAHGGVPYIGDARFLIKDVSLIFPDEDQAALHEIKGLLVTSEDAWVEGEFLLVRGRGLPPESRLRSTTDAGEPQGKRIAAIRAAKVVAMRNLAVALGKIPKTGGTAMVPPNKVRDTKYNADGSAEVVLEVRIGDIK
jgi:hypothetical protein